MNINKFSDLFSFSEILRFWLNFFPKLCDHFIFSTRICPYTPCTIIRAPKLFPFSNYWLKRLYGFRFVIAIKNSKGKLKFWRDETALFSCFTAFPISDIPSLRAVVTVPFLLLSSHSLNFHSSGFQKLFILKKNFQKSSTWKWVWECDGEQKARVRKIQFSLRF